MGEGGKEVINLTNSTVIKSIDDDQHNIIKNIIKLHIPKGVLDCDITYSKGNFYKNGVVKPEHIFDMYPQTDDTLPLGDRISLDDNSIDSIIIDLPFVVGGVRKVQEYKDGSCIIAKRFEQYRSMKELESSYKHWINEAYRVLKPNGVLVFKCQDTVSARTQHLIHVTSIVEMSKIGFYVKDLVNLLAKSRIISPKHNNQQHARKFHSYFLVAVKKKTNIKYY